MNPSVDDLVYHTVPGMVRLLVGDVVQMDGGPHMVVRSSASGATCEPMQRRHVAVEDKVFGTRAEFDRRGRVKHISGNVPPYLLLERRGEAGLQSFLAEKKANLSDFLARRKPQPGAANKPSGKETETVKMKEKNKGGDKQAKAGSKGKLGRWFGFSVCSVLRRLGKEGVGVKHAAAIVAAAGVAAKPATIQINVSAGARGQGSVAEITKEQVKELIASAPTPEN